MVPAGHFILQEHGEELGIGQLAIDSLPVAGLQGSQDAGQAQGAEVTAPSFRPPISMSNNLLCKHVPGNCPAWPTKDRLTDTNPSAKGGGRTQRLFFGVHLCNHEA
ncbi:hypothetical protein GGI1_18511 [Acidithiobacillus sp. GGI-221]|nr:hypothetical protein GGI1_18511 [Acidithiobacillus sp. GGI-221]